MSQYTSYYLYQKYVKYGDQDWLPAYPNVFSADGDGTMYPVIKQDDDPGCGYIPKGIDDYNYSKWETVDGYICEETTKFARERKYVSDDNINWIATDIYRRSTTVIEVNSTDCGYDPQWEEYNCFKWEAVSNDYNCDDGNKYTKLRKWFRICEDCSTCYEQWVASDIYKQGDIIEYNSTDCGFIHGQKEYRWINTDRFTCVGYDKHYIQQRQVSYNQGQTWNNLNEFRTGSLYEKDSSDCVLIPVIYRWIDLDPSTDYYCKGYTKYYKQQYQKSYDNGETWVNETPPTFRYGRVAETLSEDCGYIAPMTRWYPTSETLCVEN